MVSCTEKTPSLAGIHLLCVDDDRSILRSLQRVFTALGASVTVASSVREGLSKLQLNSPIAAVLADLCLQDGSGFDLIPRYLQCNPEGQFYMLTGHASVNTAVDAIRQGVAEYFEKPVDPMDLAYRLSKDLQAASSRSGLIDQISAYLQVRDPLMLSALADLPCFAKSTESVLIQGETGTGKELIARAVHGLSSRSNNPFVAVNCGAIPDSMLEAELFEFEKGAFTGAAKPHKGYFEQAHRGILFLDEIGDMPLTAQASLLRVLEENCVRRLGSEQDYPVDVRIVAATHRDLAERINGGVFREDLFFRLNTLEIKVPRLSRRPADVAFLSQYYINLKWRERYPDQPVPQLSEEVIERLQAYSWPGNVRELRNFIVRLAVKLPANLLEIGSAWMGAQLPVQSGHSNRDQEGVLIPKGTTLSDAEWLLIDEALKQTGFNRMKAAKLLGISERTLRRKLNTSV